MGLPGGTQDQDRRLVDRRRRARGARRAGPRAAAEDPRLAAALEAEIDLHRRAAGLRQSDDRPRPHQLRARRDHDRAAVLVRAEPAEHPDPHRGRPQDPHAPSSPSTGHKLVSADYSQIELRLLAQIADIPQLQQAFADGIDIHAMTASEMFGVPVEGHAGRSAPPRQGDQFRHHLRHLGLRPRQPARHPARGGRRLHQEIFRALPRHPRLHGRDQGVLPRARLSSPRSSAASATIPTSARRNPSSAPSTSARRSTRRCRARPPTSSAAP